MGYKEIVTIEPGKRGGKPCIRGMRIAVDDVLEYLASGMTQEEILQDFPYLTKEDILACLEFAAQRDRVTARSYSYLQERAEKGDRDRYDAVLAKVPDVEPETGDRWPSV